MFSPCFPSQRWQPLSSKTSFLVPGGKLSTTLSLLRTPSLSCQHPSPIREQEGSLPRPPPPPPPPLTSSRKASPALCMPSRAGCRDYHRSPSPTQHCYHFARKAKTLHTTAKQLPVTGTATSYTSGFYHYTEPKLTRSISTSSHCCRGS